jgi:hypothetical protein
MTYEQRQQLHAQVWAVEWLLCSQSLERFALHVKTRDEHGDGSFSVKAFPTREEKPGIWVALDLMQHESLLAIEKSRQLMVTWTACLYILWSCKFKKNRLCMCQGKKEEDACNLVYNREPAAARISFMELNLPPELRSVNFDRDCSYGQIWFSDTASKIWAIPEGGEKIRSYTVSILFSDEFAHQPSAREAWKAAKATIDGGGQVILVSSAAASAFMEELIRR